MSSLRIIADNLTCRRSGKTLFSDLSFFVKSGEALVITGRNGAGKSSLLAMICGRIQPAEGLISLQGAGDRPLAECINMIGHRDGLKAMLTAEENLSFARDLLGSAALSPAEALARLNVAHLAYLPVAYLSAGQRRRVALARLLVTHRPIWVMDEPTTALDSASQALLMGLMRKHLSNGGLIIVATHSALELDNTTSLAIEPPAFSYADNLGEMW